MTGAIDGAIEDADQPEAGMPVRTPDGDAALVERVRAEIDAAAHYAAAARAPSTRHAYARDWLAFTTWCAARVLMPLPADPRAVAVFLASEAARGCAPMTIGRRLAAIGHAHRQFGQQPPQQREGAAAIVEVMAGIRRSHGKPPARKHAADADVMRDILRAIVSDDIRNVRDRALLAFGVAGAFRRSELVALRVDQITREPRGLRVQFGRTKTDQDGSGQVIAIPDGRRIWPVQLFHEWLQLAGISEGLVFRKLKAGAATDQPMSDRAVARVVQARAATAGYDPQLFAGHLLRAGFITSGARAGASIFKLKEVSRHKSTDVLAGYVRDAQIFEGHAGEGFL